MLFDFVILLSFCYARANSAEMEKNSFCYFMSFCYGFCYGFCYRNFDNSTRPGAVNPRYNRAQFRECKTLSRTLYRLAA